MSKRPVIKKIYVDSGLKERSLPEQIALKTNLKIEETSKDELVHKMQNLSQDDLFNYAKQTLYFTENRGKFLKKCPGSRGVVCCNYYTINSVTGCPYDCSYCILQHYIKNNPFISVFSNREKAIEEMIDEVSKKGFLRIGTGELADSLALDHLLDETGFFLSEIAKNKSLRENIQFEFKTKSVEIDNYLESLDLYGNGLNVVTGFSVNLPSFQSEEEIGTASIEERLSAIGKLEKAGSKIAIHFDPIVMIDDFYDDYKTLINDIFSNIDLKNVVWISMGGFRHTLSLTQTIRERFSNSSLLIGEMFPSDKDNKLRYLSPIREKFYAMFLKEIGKYFDCNPPLYMCMEKGFMWSKLNLDLKNLKDSSLKTIF